MLAFKTKTRTFMCTVWPALKKVGKCSPTRRLTKETCLEFMLRWFCCPVSITDQHTYTDQGSKDLTDDAIRWEVTVAPALGWLIFFHTGNYISMERDRTEIKTVLVPHSHPLSSPPPLSPQPCQALWFYSKLINKVAFNGWVSSNVLQSIWNHNKLL